MKRIVDAILLGLCFSVLQIIIIIVFLTIPQKWGIHPNPLRVELVSFIYTLVHIPLILFFSRKYKISLSQNFKFIDYKQVTVLLVVVLCLSVLLPIYGYPIKFFENLRSDRIEIILPLIKDFDLVYSIHVLTIVLISPILQEYLFRGVLFKLLYHKHSAFTSILVSSLIFAAVHLDFGQIWYTFFGGVIFCWFYYKTNNLIVPIILHIGFNFFFHSTRNVEVTADSPYFLLCFFMGLLSAVIIFLVMKKIDSLFTILSSNCKFNDNLVEEKNDGI